MTGLRPLVDTDLPALEAAIPRDSFHPEEWTLADFVHDPESEDSRARTPKYVTVIEDSKGPVAFVRYTKTLRICCVWNDDKDTSRNARAIIRGLHDAAQKARDSGFTEIIIQTDHDKLAKFFTDVLGIKKSDGEFILTV